MLQAIRQFVLSDRGDAIQWIIVTIIGAIIAGVAFTKFKNSPGNVGSSITEAANNAAAMVNQIRGY